MGNQRPEHMDGAKTGLREAEPGKRGELEDRGKRYSSTIQGVKAGGIRRSVGAMLQSWSAGRNIDLPMGKLHSGYILHTGM